MHLFIYLSLERTQSATPDVFLQLPGISRRDQSPPSSRVLPWDPSPGEMEHFGFIDVYGCVYCPRAGTAKGFLGRHLHCPSLPASPNYQFPKIASNSKPVTFQTGWWGRIKLSTKSGWWVQTSAQPAGKSGIKIFLCFPSW